MKADSELGSGLQNGHGLHHLWRSHFGVDEHPFDFHLFLMLTRGFLGFDNHSHFLVASIEGALRSYRSESRKHVVGMLVPLHSIRMELCFNNDAQPVRA